MTRGSGDAWTSQHKGGPSIPPNGLIHYGLHSAGRSLIFEAVDIPAHVTPLWEEENGQACTESSWIRGATSWEQAI